MSTTLRLIKEDDLEMIMNWRMSEHVTKYMNTNPKLTLDGQKKWLSSQRTDNTVRNWMIEVDGIPAGVINLADIDWKRRTASWGYYIGEESLRSLKLAISLEMSLYDYCFELLNFSEVYNDVFKLNEGVWKLHVACGCKIVKEKQKKVEKEGVLYDTVHLSIQKDEWSVLRGAKKYEKIDFDLFHDPLGGMKLHHLGIAAAEIENSIQSYRGLGWVWDGKIIEDEERNVILAFLHRPESGELIELVSPSAENSPVSSTLSYMKNVSAPYHICYETDDIEKSIRLLKNRKYILVSALKPAIAFENRRVAFLLNKDAGLIELLESEKIYK